MDDNCMGYVMNRVKGGCRAVWGDGVCMKSVEVIGSLFGDK